MNLTAILESEKLLDAILNTPREQRPSLSKTELEILKAQSLKVFGTILPHGEQNQTSRTATEENKWTPNNGPNYLRA